MQKFSRTSLTGFICFLIASMWAMPAEAYVGPAVAFVSYLLGPVAAVIAVIGIILYLPVKMLVKKWRASKGTVKDDAVSEAASKVVGDVSED